MKKRLYKYEGTISEMMNHSDSFIEITLYDRSDEEKAPTRLSVYGKLAKYIYELECTDAEERYLKVNYYYDNLLHLRKIEVPAADGIGIAKAIIEVTGRAFGNSEDFEGIVIFGNQDFIESSKPQEMDAASKIGYAAFRMEME